MSPSLLLTFGWNYLDCKKWVNKVEFLSCGRQARLYHLMWRMVWRRRCTSLQEIFGWSKSKMKIWMKDEGFLMFDKEKTCNGGKERKSDAGIKSKNWAAAFGMCWPLPAWRSPWGGASLFNYTATDIRFSSSSSSMSSSSMSSSLSWTLLLSSKSSRASSIILPQT